MCTGVAAGRFAASGYLCVLPLADARQLGCNGHAWHDGSRGVHTVAPSSISA